MFKYLVPIVNPLILLIGFWLFFSYHKGVGWLALISIIVILISGRILSQRHFWRFWLLWLNLATAYLAQLLFLLLVTSSRVRHIISFLLAICWAVIWLLLKKYWQTLSQLDNKDYLAFSKFFYYLSFWFLSSSVYSLIIFLSLPLYSAFLVVLAIAGFWAKEILDTSQAFGRYYLWLAVFLLAQVLIALYFMPISSYAMGAIATFWFFFIIDNTMHQFKYFKVYLGLFLLGVFALLFTSIL